jgi:hypothetical protein
MALVLKTDGSVTKAPAPVGVGYTLKEVKAALGLDDRRLIEEVRIGRTHALLIDEEGKLQDLPLNPGATLLAMKYGALFAGDYIVGNAMWVEIDGTEWVEAGGAPK